jgi:23S rRNA (uracil1939-C5)-methyltransferase
VIADAFARIAHVILPAPWPVVRSPEDAYRMRARFHVRGSRVGFFREGSHTVCDPRPTRQVLTSTCDVVERLASAIQSLAIAVREIAVAENVDASQRAFSLDLAATVDARPLERLAGMDGVTGLATAFGSFGNPYVSDQMTVEGGTVVALRRHATSFFQGNRHLLREFAAHVVRQVPSGGELLDLYAGVGMLSISAAAARGARAAAVEGDRMAASDLAANAAASGAAVRAVHQPVEDFVGGPEARTLRSRTNGELTVIVDPPRTGLSPAAVDGLLRIRPARIIYVSCDVATLARDTRKVIDAGYRIGGADAFDLFPNTPHIETIVVFDLTT